MNSKLAALNINFDTLPTIASQKAFNEKALLENRNDPCYFSVLDRFLSFSKKYRFRYSIYLIGKELENANIARRVKELASMGHELGNHSFSHLSNLGELSEDIIEQEVFKSHLIIKETSGIEPKGFIAPAWSTSRNLVKILIKTGYKYDTSLFPSYIMPIIQAKLKVSSDKEYRNHINIIRNDFIGNLFGQTKPFWATEKRPFFRSKSESSNGLMSLPLPTVFPRIPIWHTNSFRLSKRLFIKLLKTAIKQNKFFYYLMHPADLFDPIADITGYPKSLLKFERMEVPIEKKMELIQEAINIIMDNCKIVTMEELCDAAKQQIASST